MTNSLIDRKPRPSYWFIYSSERGTIRIRSKRKPGPNTIPRQKTWVVQEQVQQENRSGFFSEYVLCWQMPSFPEITWGTLKGMKFIGKDFAA